jgi:trimeric autotransporter adhesin
VTYPSGPPRLLAPLALAFALALTACDSGDSLAPPTGQGDTLGPPNTPDTASRPDTSGGGQRPTVFVSPGILTLAVGDSARLLAWTRAAPRDSIPAPSAVWSSSDTLVALVSPTGVVRARSAGSARISATVDGRSGTAAVTVSGAPSGRLEVSPADTTVDEGRLVPLTVRLVTPSGGGAPADSVTWRVGDANAARVSAYGLVLARRAGTVVVTTTRGALTGTARITIRPAALGSLEVEPPDGTRFPEPFLLPRAERLQLLTEVRDTEGRHLPGRRLDWSSTSPAATVDSTGLVTARQAGTATPFATSGGRTSGLPLQVP